MVDDQSTRAVVVYVRSDGSVLIERPGLDPVLVIADTQLATEQGHAPEGRPAPAPQTVPPGDPAVTPHKPFVIPKIEPTYVALPRSYPVLKARVGSE